MTLQNFLFAAAMSASVFVASTGNAVTCHASCSETVSRYIDHAYIATPAELNAFGASCRMRGGTIVAAPSCGSSSEAWCANATSETVTEIATGYSSEEYRARVAAQETCLAILPTAGDCRLYVSVGAKRVGIITCN